MPFYEGALNAQARKSAGQLSLRGALGLLGQAGETQAGQELVLSGLEGLDLARLGPGEMSPN